MNVNRNIINLIKRYEAKYIDKNKFNLDAKQNSLILDNKC